MSITATIHDPRQNAYEARQGIRDDLDDKSVTLALLAIDEPLTTPQAIAGLSAGAKRLCRKLAGAHANCPVKTVPGSAEPELKGTSYHYRTRGGRLIHYPSAYSRWGWSNMVYCPSTVRVEVGEKWLAAADRAR